MPSGPGESTRISSAVTPLGGVRADFVANLGRRVAELRQAWAAFEQDPAMPRLRDDARRRIHALTTRARLLEFVAMADKLDEAARRLDETAASGTLDSKQLAWFHELFAALPSLAWNESGSEPAPMRVPSPPRPAVSPEAPSEQHAAPAPDPAPEGFQSPCSILVVGGEGLAAALSEPVAADQPAFECEREEDLSVALDLARALAPDLVVVDADLDGAVGFITALSDDPLTEPVPVVVVGSWSHADQTTDLLSVGVVRCVPKPATPDMLRSAAEQAIASGRHPAFDPAPMGELTVEEVADRLVAQLRAGLVQSVKPESQNFKIPVGQGSELLAAVWSAVARVRENLTIRSHGQVRFVPRGPSGAVPIAPWLEDPGTEPPPRRSGGREAAAPTDTVRLEGRKVLVVDDDPAITWFLSGLLRGVGAFVYEAHNGRRALELAFRSTPDLVITDIIMPELDGFGLCRELKRDIALRDAPVILLSWKEDLLQRVRELGARADGYIKKESSAPAVLRRVHEVLQPRLRIEARLKAGGEVRGRLDGLTSRTLLQLVGAAMPDARVTVRDSHFVYEIELREGAPRVASRTSMDGAFVRGPEALGALLGASSGRFQVVPSTVPVRESMTGDLASQINPMLARARAAQRLLSGDGLLQVDRVQLDLDRMRLEALPADAREIVGLLQQGHSPRELVISRREPASLIEALLDDAAIHGAVAHILGRDGADLLGPATGQMLEAMSAPVHSVRAGRASPASKAAAPGGTTAPLAPAAVQPAAPAQPAPVAQPGKSPEPTPERLPAPAPVPAPVTAAALPAPSPAKPAEPAQPPREEPTAPPPEGHSKLAPGRVRMENDYASLDGIATSLTEAVIREVLDPAERRLPSPTPPASMLDARELKPRTMRSLQQAIPSLPPDAIVPAHEPPSDTAASPEPAVPAGPSLPPENKPPVAAAVSRRQPAPKRSPGEMLPPPHHPSARTWPSATSDPKAIAREKALRRMVDEIAANEEQVPKSSIALPLVLAVLMLAALVGAGIWLKLPVALQRGWGPRHSTHPAASLASAVPLASAAPGASEPASAAPASAAPAASPSPAASASAFAAPSASSAELAADEGEEEEEVDIPKAARVPAGTAMIEVRSARPDAVVFVDGREVGSGAVVATVARPGKHTVLVRSRGKEVVREVIARADRMKRLSLVLP